MGDHGLHRLSLGERRAWLYQPRRRQARPGSDRSGEGRRELRVRSCGPLSDHRTDHGARTPVPSSRHLRDRSGHLRCRVDRPPRSMARHERGQDGEERSDASRAARGGGGAGEAAGAAATGGVFGDQEVAQTRRPQRTPLQSRQRGGRSAIRVLRRGLDPDSDADADGRPQALLHLWRRARTRWISGSSIWPAPSPFSSPAGEARTSRRTTRGISPVSRATTRENGRSSSSGHFAQARAPPFVPGEFLPVAFSVWDGFSRERGNRRGLTAWYSIYVEPEVVTSAVGPMVRTALLILVIELVVIGWVRRRYGHGARGELGA